MNKRKIINDPVYGFISIPYDIVYDLIEHPYFQRLRNIKQLGQTHLVYPGALHTRFHHALGAMHLMAEALESIQAKGQLISEEEAQGATIAILLHDVGHGPYSHALESCIIEGISHEDISGLMMDELNRQFEGKLSLAIDIFKGTYEKGFLHQLVSSQLDMDRLDYLNRDSFYTGVSEGVIGFDRILKMLLVVNDELMIEEKGIYSIEKFLIARRLMYWQVYLHKTVIAAEQLLVQILKRAKELALVGTKLFASPAFSLFLYERISRDEFMKDPAFIEAFSKLDDHDIFSSVKVWTAHEDPILSKLCTYMLSRKLYGIQIQKEPFSVETVYRYKRAAMEKFGVSETEANYFVFEGTIHNNAYDPEIGRINILRKDGSVIDIAQASDNLNIHMLANTVEKHYLCYSKEI